MNKIMLIGRVGHTPEIINTDGGRFAKLSLATSERYTKDGERKEITDWHSLVVNGKLVDVVEKYVGKGKQIFVEGKMRYRKYTGKDNVEKIASEVYVTGLELLGGGDTPQTAQDTPQQPQTPADGWQPTLNPLDNDESF